MSSNNAVGTYELGAQPVRRDQCDGGPMRWGTNGMGGVWVPIGGPMGLGTSEMGDHWDWPKLGG